MSWLGQDLKYAARTLARSRRFTAVVPARRAARVDPVVALRYE